MARHPHSLANPCRCGRGTIRRDLTWLLNVYWFSLGVGGLYLLIAGTLGAIGASGHGAGGDGGAHGLDGGHGFDAGHDFDAAHDAGSHGLEAAGHDSAELPAGDLDAGSHDSGAGHHPHGTTLADHRPDGGQSSGDISPFNLLNLMCLLASFGGTGLALIASRMPPLLTFPLALAGGLLTTALFHWIVARVLLRMQAADVPTQDDMLGLDAEVLTPLDGEHFGEIAYTLDGQRFTSPARLLKGERAGRKDSVTIVKVEGSTVYVEPRRKLLE